MKNLKKNYKIKASIEEIWKALTDPEYINNWGAGPNVKMDENIGTDFSLWDSEISGKNIEVKRNQKLVQEWKDRDCPKDAKPSIVTFMIFSNGEFVDLVLHHENIPDSSFDSINNGWDEYYLGPLKK